MLDIQALIDDARRFQVVRDLRWPQGVRCPHCDSDQITQQGYDESQPARRRYLCRPCSRKFDDLTGTLFAGHHQPLRVWVLGLYLLGLNLSDERIARELDLDPDAAQRMCAQLRQGIIEHKPTVALAGEVECDEVYVVAGHKGHPEAVRKKQRPGRRRRLKGKRGRGTLAKEKPPIFGMIQRTGEVVIRMPEDVQRVTIGPIIRATISPGSVVYTDE